MPNSTETLAPGIYIQEVTSLPHPLPCVSTGVADLLSLASRAPSPAGVTDHAKSPRAVVNRAGGQLALPGGTNLLRFFPARGNLIWGARTTPQDPQWQYVNVRRLMIYIEQSLSQGLQWAVFENNNSLLWGRVINSVGNFLQSLVQQGALQSNGAYFVRCGSDTMTQDDLDAGQLVLVVGVAPVYPAEFVVFQITVQTNQTKKKK